MSTTVRSIEIIDLRSVELTEVDQEHNLDLNPVHKSLILCGHFSQEIGFTLVCDIENENILHLDSNPRSMGYGTRSLPLSYLP